jgi:hypothetical protein
MLISHRVLGNGLHWDFFEFRMDQCYRHLIIATSGQPRCADVLNWGIGLMGLYSKFKATVISRQTGVSKPNGKKIFRKTVVQGRSEIFLYRVRRLLHRCARVRLGEQTGNCGYCIATGFGS